MTDSLAPSKPLWRPGENPTVDLVLFRRRPATQAIEILMIRRVDDSPACPGMLANPGGFVDSTTPRGEPFEPAETPREAALRELAEETGLAMERLDSLLKEIGRYGGLERDPRSTPQAYIVSTAFAALLEGELGDWGDHLFAASDAKDAGWLPLERLLEEPLAFDHGRIIEDAARALGILLPGRLRSWSDARSPKPPSPR